MNPFRKLHEPYHVPSWSLVAVSELVTLHAINTANLILDPSQLVIEMDIVTRRAPANATEAISPILLQAWERTREGTSFAMSTITWIDAVRRITAEPTDRNAVFEGRLFSLPIPVVRLDASSLDLRTQYDGHFKPIRPHSKSMEVTGSRSGGSRARVRVDRAPMPMLSASSRSNQLAIAI